MLMRGTVFMMLVCCAAPCVAQDRLERVERPLTLNGSGRGVFADVLLRGDRVWAVYQTARPRTLVDGKHLFLRIFDRQLKDVAGERKVIDVYAADPRGKLMLDGDLGDHKLTVMGDRVYILAMVKGKRQAGIWAYDSQMRRIVAGPTWIGQAGVDRWTDMGLGQDGTYLYAQAFHQPRGTGPDRWAAKLVKLDRSLKVVKQGIVRPDSGTFVTGTAVVARGDRLAVFSTNRDYGSRKRVGIHTFTVDAKTLRLVRGSTKTIIERELDVYFPVGVSWNKRHRRWLVGYTMEPREDAHGRGHKELGPSFVALFDERWNLLQTVSLNNGQWAFRVMIDTSDDDVYVVYDEMDKAGKTSRSRARLERFKFKAK